MTYIKKIPLYAWYIILLIAYLIPFVTYSEWRDLKSIELLSNAPAFMLTLILFVVLYRKSGTQRIQLEQRYEQLNSIIEHLDIAVFTYDIHNQKAYCSSGMEKMTGYQGENFQGFMFWMTMIHPEDKQRINEAAGLLEKGFQHTGEYRIITAKGAVRWIQLRMFPISNPSGKLEHLNGVVLDVTERKNMEHTLTVSEQRYKSLFQYNTDVICETDLDSRIISTNMAYTKLLRDLDLNVEPEYFLEMISSPQDRWEALRAFEGTKSGTTNRYQISLLKSSGEKMHWDVKCVPVFVNGSVVGAHHICKDITLHMDMQKALRESEERYRMLVELSPQPIALVNMEGAIEYVNSAAIQAAGAQRADQLISRRVVDMIHSDYLDLSAARTAVLRQGGAVGAAEYQLIRLDGEIIDVEVASIFDKYTKNIQLVFKDITHRKLAEKALRESEERYRRLVEYSPVAIAVHKDLKLIYVNPEAVQLFGAADVESYLGADLREFIDPEYRAQMMECFQETVELGYSQLREYQVTRADGQVITVEATAIYDQHTHSAQIVLNDITARKKAESQLVEDGENYLRLQASLDRFSSEMVGVMKVHEMESRLLQEVGKILHTDALCILEVAEKKDYWIKCGSLAKSGFTDIFAEQERKHGSSIGEIRESKAGYYVKIADYDGKRLLLCISEGPGFLYRAPDRVWLQTIVRYANTLYDNFRVIEDLTNELHQTTDGQSVPTWLLRIVFMLSENERKQLAQDLHDSALQEQIIWYRKLDTLLLEEDISEAVHVELEHIREGLMDVMYQIRLTCNELRPPFLREWGLLSSLENLFEHTQLRADYAIEFHSADFGHDLNDEQSLGIYRIVQELLSNAAKHSNADQVRITLASRSNGISLTYMDNGVGLETELLSDSYESMGIYGMRERIRSLDGWIEFQSAPNEGVHVSIYIPVAA
jgi:two-component system, NarL family, sensor histidine kinase ComP